MAYPAIRGSVGNLGSATKAQINQPSTTQVGDLLLFFSTAAAATTLISPESGYNNDYQETAMSGHASRSLVFCWKIADAAGTQLHQPFDFSGVNTAFGTVCLALQAGTFDSADPLADFDINASGDDPPANSGALATKDYLQVVAAGYFFSAGGTYAITAPTNYTEQIELVSGSGAGDLSVATRQVNTGQDPGDFTTDNDAAIAQVASFALMVNPANQAPNTPTLDSPANGATIYANQSNTFQFDATDPDTGDTRTGVALKVTIDGVTRWWKSSTATWETTEVFSALGGVSASFPDLDRQIVIPANEFNDFDTNGSGTWSIAVQDLAGATSPYSSTRSFTILPTPSQTISPSSIASAEAFGTSTVSPGSVTVSPSAVASGEVFGSGTISPGAVTVSPSGIATEEVHGTQSISRFGTLEPVGIASQEAFGTPSWQSIVSPRPIHGVAGSSATFSRASVAYDVKGRQVAVDVPRYEDVVNPNLLTLNEASIETDTTDWASNSNSTLTKDTTTKMHGAASLKAASTAGGIHSIFCPNPSVTYFPVTPGVSYCMSAYLLAGTQGRNCRIDINWLDAVGAVVGSATQGATSLSSTTEWRRFYASGVCPAGAVNARITVRFSDAAIAVGEAHYLDCAQWEVGTAPSAFQLPGQSFGKGIFVEEGTTNLVNTVDASTGFEDAFWAKSQCSITQDAAQAPDGTMSADKLVEAAVNGTHSVLRSTLLTVGVAGAVSVYAKAAERTAIGILIDSVASIFDLSAGVVAVTGAGHTTSIVALGDGWYRCSVAKASIASSQSVQIRPASGTSTSYLGDGVSGIHIWHPQAEAKAYATTWQIGGTARAAENLSASVAGLSPTAGTWEQLVYVDARIKEQSLDRRVFVIRRPDAAGTCLTLKHRQGFASWHFQARDSNGSFFQATIDDSLIPDGLRRFSITWEGVTCKVFVDGVLRGTLTLVNGLDGFSSPAYIGSFGGADISSTTHDDLRISNRAKTDAEIAAAYATGAPLAT